MHKDHKVVEMTAGPSKREENVWRVADYLQQVSCCPACQQQRGVLLILPCSHTMCVPCISAGEAAKATKSHRSAGCSVPCPRCLHPVELPCGNRSSAPSCLPKHPTGSPACVNPDVTKGPHHQVRRADYFVINKSNTYFSCVRFCPLGSIYLEERAPSGYRTDGNSETFTR